MKLDVTCRTIRSEAITSAFRGVTELPPMEQFFVLDGNQDDTEVDGTLETKSGIKASLKFLENLLETLDGATIIVRKQHGLRDFKDPLVIRPTPYRLDFGRNSDSYDVVMSNLEGEPDRYKFEIRPPRTEHDPVPELIIRGPRPE